MTEMEMNGGALASASLNGDSDTILAEISFFLLTSQSAYAGTFTYQKDFKRRNGLPANRESYRRKAMGAVEAMILNELVLCLGEEPAVKYFELSMEEVKTLAQAILQRNVMEEQWDGQNYYLRARIIGDSTNSDAYPAMLGQVQEKARALIEARERAREAIEEVKKLEWELEETQTSVRLLKAVTTDELEAKDAAAARVREGDKLWESGDYEKAASAYESAMAYDSTSADAFVGRGVAYFGMGEWAKAAEDFDRACELRPGDVTAHVNRGSALAKMGYCDRALDALNRALTLDSGSFDGYLNRGIIHMVHRSDLDSALRDFTEAIRLRPHDHRGYHLRAGVYARMGRYEAAIDDYDQSLARNAEFASSYFNRANALMRVGDARKAIEDYTRFLDRFVDHVGGHFNRALAHAEVEDYGNALSDLDRVIALDPAEPKARLCRGIVHFWRASVNLARNDWEEASKLGDPAAKEYLGEILH